MLLLVGALVGACSDDGGGGAPTTTATRSPTTTPGPALVAHRGPATGTAPGDGSAIVYELDWTLLRATPYFGYDDETDPDDPFWHLQTQADEDFLLGLEMYTTGFGEAWAGETGTFDLGCGVELTGICLHLDPDGEEGPAVDLNADFRATGTIEIDRLEDDGYDVTLSDVEFSDGSTLPGPARLAGEPG